MADEKSLETTRKRRDKFFKKWGVNLSNIYKYCKKHMNMSYSTDLSEETTALIVDAYKQYKKDPNKEQKIRKFVENHIDAPFDNLDHSQKEYYYLLYNKDFLKGSLKITGLIDMVERLVLEEPLTKTQIELYSTISELSEYQEVE